MPYTREQINEVSRSTRRVSRFYHHRIYPSHFAAMAAVDTLRLLDNQSRWEYERALNSIQDLECENCGEVYGFVDGFDEVHIRPGNVEVEANGELFCSSECAHEAGWEQCYRCREWIAADDAFSPDGDCCYCGEHCAERDGWTRCDHCGDWVHQDNTWRVGDEDWCEPCYDEDSRECEGCGDRHPVADMYRDDYGYWYCESCSRHIDALHDYGYRPTLRFFGQGGTNTPYLGVELETDSGVDRSEYVSELNSLPKFSEHFWMTKDSSLDNGVEITSHPMTLKYHLDMNETYQSIGAAASNYGFVSHNSGNCGLHVHVNRNFFGKSEICQDAGGYKMMRLLQRFEPMFTIFARRTPSQVNSWCKFKTYRDYKPKEQVKILKADYMDNLDALQLANEMKRNERSHGQALNFQHSSTFEFRIFRGTLKWSTYFASLALVNGLCHVAKSHGSVWVEDVSWYDLMDEVIALCDDERGREYLAAYLDEKGLRQ